MQPCWHLIEVCLLRWTSLRKSNEKHKLAFKKWFVSRILVFFGLYILFFGALQLLVDIWRFPKMGILPVHLYRCFIFGFPRFFYHPAIGGTPMEPPSIPILYKNCAVQSNSPIPIPTLWHHLPGLWNHFWLVVFRHPSEKWWTESQLGWWHSIPNWTESQNPAMFQSPPTRLKHHKNSSSITSARLKILRIFGLWWLPWGSHGISPPWAPAWDTPSSPMQRVPRWRQYAPRPATPTPMS